MYYELVVKSYWFYTLKSEKTKFNWFCYEYALLFYELLMESADEKLKKWLSTRTKEQVAEFCAYFSKRMKKSVEDKLSDVTDATILDEDYISDYCHMNTHSENLALLAVGEKAWDEHTSACVICPTRCISERYAQCVFFDRMKRRGWST